jgi:thiamine biosynthesis protein ThiS
MSQHDTTRSQRDVTRPPGATVTVTVNGADRAVPAGATVAELLASLGLAPEQVAVELDCALLSRDLHASTALAGGESLEVVTLVGGG